MQALHQAQFEIADLPGSQIASVASSHIKIDETGAGYGWYIDQFPSEDGEFDVPVPNRELQTTEFSPAFGRMDLLTVLMRELGTVYLQGKDRVPKKVRPLMNPLLLTGVRPMNEVFPLQRAADAYELMMSGKARFRVVLTIH